MKASLSARLALVLGLLVTSPARAHIQYLGKGFTKPVSGAADQALAPDDSFAIANSEPRAARWVWRMDFSDPRIRIVSWRGSDEFGQFLPNTSFEVGFGGSLGIADVAYLPIPVDADLWPQFATAAPELSTVAMTALGFAAIALAAGAMRRPANAAPHLSV